MSLGDYMYTLAKTINADLWTNDFYAGLGIGLILLASFLGLALIAFTAVYRWKLFIKAGKDGWEAIIPFYIGWTLFEISGFPGWMSLISYVSFIPVIRYIGPLAALALSIVTSISLCKKFNRQGYFWLLVALVPFVGLPIIAFSNDKYDKTKGEQKNMQSIK